MNVIVCYATCWACRFGQCDNNPDPQPHPWWGPDDVEDAEYRRLPAPEGDCACPCGQPS